MGDGCIPITGPWKGPESFCRCTGGRQLCPVLWHGQHRAWRSSHRCKRSINFPGSICNAPTQQQALISPEHPMPPKGQRRTNEAPVCPLDKWVLTPVAGKPASDGWDRLGQAQQATSTKPFPQTVKGGSESQQAPRSFPAAVRIHTCTVPEKDSSSFTNSSQDSRLAQPVQPTICSRQGMRGCSCSGSGGLSMLGRKRKNGINCNIILCTEDHIRLGQYPPMTGQLTS